jgi:hypothetical protein
MGVEDDRGMDSSPEISMPFYIVWWTALTNPKESTYLQLVQDPGANFRKALLWLSIVYVIEAPIGIFRIFHGVLDVVPDIKELLGEAQGVWVGVLVLFLVILFLTPLWVFLRVLFFLFLTALLDVFAVILFRGQGRYADFVYLSAAYSAPSSLLNPGLKIVPYGNVISMALIAYQVALTALALKIANRFSWGRAIGSILIPLILLLIIIVIIVVYLSNLFDHIFDMFGV